MKQQITPLAGSDGQSQAGAKDEPGGQKRSEEQGFAREMGLPGAPAIGLAAMLGAAIFVVGGGGVARAGLPKWRSGVRAGLIELYKINR